MTQRRFYETVYRGHSGPGRAVVGLRCPFCAVVVEAYVWSLAGVGKRCECGAKFTGVPGGHLAVSVLEPRL